MKKRIMGSLLFFIYLWITFPMTVKAEKPNVIMNDEEEITWTTTDTKATSGIRWSTKGFTVRKDTCLPKGDPRKKPFGEFMIKESWKKEDIDNGKVYVTFTIPKEVVTEQIEKAGVTPKSLEKSKQRVYLNGIFQVTTNGKPTGGLKKTLKSIENAAPWRNPKDFEDRFDIPVDYNPKPQTVQITYMQTDSNKKTTFKTIKNSSKIWTKEYSDDKTTFEDGCGMGFSKDKYQTHSYFTLSGWSVPMKKSKVVNGAKKEYYLYRVHWAKLSDPLKTTSSGQLRKAYEVMSTKYNPLTQYEQYKADLDRIRHRKLDVKNGGVEIVAVYKQFKKSSKPPAKPPEGGGTPEDMTGEIVDPVPKAVIQADDRGNEKFDSTKGIPTTENQYVQVTTKKYIYNYTFSKKTGTKSYPEVYKETEPGEDGEPVEVEKERSVERSYSYWTITRLNIYAISGANVSNYSLPGEEVKLTADAKVKPKVEYALYHGSNLKEPEGVGTEKVGEIPCRNDRLVIDGVTIMNDSWQEGSTQAPISPKESGDVGPDDLYQAGLAIDRDKENGEHTSEGYVTYALYKQIGEKDETELSYDIDLINDVVIHTPTVCDAKVQDVKEYNQLLRPNRGVAGFILDRPFQVSIPTTGAHADLKGYGYKDYAKYIARREVKFPFDVYSGTTYFPAETWITLTGESASFYLPIWVDEGDYTIEFRSRAVNCDANDGLEQTEDLANLDFDHYVASDTADVEVSGRVYGMKLYDISDYPIWELVFRKKNSLALTDFRYAVGTKDQNGTSTGRNPKYTFPLVNGDHPMFGNIGVQKTGYVSRFEITTIGNMYSNQDYVKIKPKFYWIDTKGHREEVDVYYSETFNGKWHELVKAGSKLDQENTKVLRLGDTYLSAPERELLTKAQVTGQTLNQTKANKAKVYTFTDITIPEQLRTYTGTNYTPTGTVPDGVDPVKVTQSKQKWYFEYYLPSEIHVCPKNFDVMDYGRKHYGIDYQEEFWKKEGYLLVQFDTETIQGNESHLSYINASNAEDGYCNMWQLEGTPDSKTDYKGNTWYFKDGDTLLYFLDKSAAKDYKAGGTH